MPLSISSSDATATGSQATRAIVWLLCILAFLYGLVELAAGVGFPRISRIQRRITGEYQQARTLGPVHDGKPTLLLLGNSLLLEGLNYPKLRADLAPEYEVSRYIVEQTQYFDWFFGLKRLFREGSRPRIVVLCLSTNHLLSPAVRGEYFAHFQMAAADFLEVAREARLDNTTASTYWMANASPWIGSQEDLRKWLLIRLMPNIVLFTNRLQRPAPPQPAAEVVEARLLPRLQALKELTGRHGARLVVVIPPTVDPNDRAAAGVSAGAKAGVPVLVPYMPQEMPASQFRDGFHLTEEGAEAFTVRLEEQLRGIL